MAERMCDRFSHEVFRGLEKKKMKRRSVVFLIFVILLIGSDIFLIYKITTEKTAESNATTTSFTTRFTTHESISSNRNPPETTVATRTTTNTAIFSTGSTTSTTNASTNATSATNATSLSSTTTSSSSVTTVTSQPAESTVETTFTTSTMTTESTSEIVPTTVTESTTKITTTDPPWTKESTIETSASTSEVPETASEQTTTEIKTTKVVTPTEVTTDVDATTHETAIACNGEFNYIARDADTGVACVWANMTIQIMLRYMTNYCQENETTLIVPKETKTSGICNKKTAQMILSWKDVSHEQANDDIKENKIIFRYIQDDSKYFLDSTSVDVYLDDDNFPNAQRKRIKEDIRSKHLRLFSTSMKHGTLIRQLEAQINGDQVNVLISDISLIAFTGCSEALRRDDNYTASAGVKSAIAGGIIGPIVLIFVIFFLIWRKRKKNAARPEHRLP